MILSRRQMVALLAAAAQPEWRRSHPDFEVYIPPRPDGPDNTNQHFLVTPLPDNTFLAMGPPASRESAADQHMASSRSTDGGRTWSRPIVIDGASKEDPPGSGLASWGFPIVAPKLGRVYAFFNKNTGVQDVRTADTGALRARWSEDSGRSWSQEYREYPIGRDAYSHQDPKVPSTWIVYQPPVATPGGAIIAGFTRWASSTADRKAASMFDRGSEISFLRFENILSERDPAKLIVTTWPQGTRG